jgi:hypothetical protein
MALLGLGLGACDSDGPAAASSAAAGDDSATSAETASGTVGEGGAAADEDAGQAEAPPPGTPVVDLAGVAHLPGELPDDAPKLAAIGWVTPILKKPDPAASRLGSLRAGAVVTRSAEPVGQSGCPGGWYRIEPRGFVCVGKEATLDLNHPIARATARRPDYAHRLPYMYGTCTRGGPIYARIPSAEHLKEFEPSLAKHLDEWRNDEVSGATYGLDVWLRYTKHKVPTALDALEQKVTDEVIPAYLRDGAKVPDLSGLVEKADSVKIGQVDRRTGRSFIESFLHEGRRYNVTPDLVVIPADRFRPIRGSDFHGWQVGEELTFPFALVRRPGAKKWLWRGKDKKMVDGGALRWRSAVMLTGKQRFYRKRLHYQTKEGFWVDDRHAGRVDPAKRWPKWAKNGEKWIDINITKQVLVAYEGKRAVFATLVSTGEAGLSDHEESTATIKGIFRIHTKLVAATMDSDEVGEEFELRDVPYVQYFKEGYAIHGAYWHDGFGRPKSHGCVNLAPEDARRLFFWTAPHVPPRWHSARKSLTGTVVFIHP